jgi:Tfp pilus assembly protein PilN
MLLINLIAARRAERRKLELIRGGMLRGMVGVVATTGIVALLATLGMTRTTLRIRDVDAQTALLQDTVNKVETLQADIKNLEPRVNTLVRAQNSTDRWRGVMQAVSASLPDKTWVTSFQSKDAAKNSVEGFTVTGQTVTHDRIGRTMMKLNRSAFVKQLDLSYAAQRQEGSGVSFELGAELKPLEGAGDAS